MRHPKDLSRRDFLIRAGGATLALPTMSAILAACSKPGTDSGGASASASDIPIATLEQPVELPLTQDPIAADTPIEGGPLILYNWDDYIYKRRSPAFEDEFGVDVEITTFNNMEEGIQKLVSGQVTPDVFVPTPGYLRRLVQKDLLQPLQHELVPNMANVWPIFSDPGPVLRPEWNYTVPYMIYTRGVAYRRDRVEDARGWQRRAGTRCGTRLQGAIAYYDSYGDTIAIMLLRNGSLDANSADPAVDRRREGRDPGDDQR